MALIKCPECGKEISSQAGACPNCGCPIANKPTSIKIRALSDDGKIRCVAYKINGKVVAQVPLGSTATIHINEPTRIRVENWTLFSTYAPTEFVAIPGKCYESRYCVPKFLKWETIVTEVSIIS